MSNSLLPERSVQFSPSLAAAIGVEASILLQHLQLLSETAVSPEPLKNRQGFDKESLHTSYAALESQLPFWSTDTIRRIMHELDELGMLQLSSQPRTAQETFRLSLSSTRKQSAVAHSAGQAAPQPTPSSLSGASKITQHWRPDAAALDRLAQHGVPTEFVQSLIPEFTFYWRERNEASHAWSSKFVQHATRRWQQQQQYNSASQQPHDAIEKSWQPSEDALEILERMGINRNFIVDAIPEFILYWQERNEPVGTWNSKFVAHTKRQWARFTNTLKNDTDPSVIPREWSPDPDVMEVLALANIDASFAKSLIPEFVIYWRERGELHHSWGTKFLQYVKRKWSNNHRTNESAGGQLKPHEKNRSTFSAGKTRDRSLSEDLFDRSWAN